MLQLILLGTPGFLDESSGTLARSTDARVIGASQDAADARDLATDMLPDAVVVDADLEEALQSAAEVARRVPKTMVFIAADRPGVDLYRRAISHGLRGVLRKPLDGREVLQMVEAARADENRLTSGIRADEPRPREERYAPTVHRQEVVVFWSPKGGVGKTTLAVNLAAAYLKTGIMRPVVVDLDVFPNMAAMLQVSESASVSDWATVDSTGVDRKTLDSLTVRHSSGLNLVPGIRRLTDEALLTSDVTATMIDVLKRHYDIIVLDAGPQLRDSTLVAFQQATRIYVIGTLDIATLKSINKEAENLELLQVDTQKVRLLLNRVPKSPDLKVSEVKDYLAYPLGGKMPEEPLLQAFANRGELAVLAKSDLPFSIEVRKLAGGVAPIRSREPAARGAGLFRRVFARVAR
ncbi:MAG: AAA family ATPase [Bacillota bacterium]